MKLVAIFGKGSNQHALSHRIDKAVPIDHLAIIELPPPSRRRRLIRSAISITLARSLRSAWLGMQRYYADMYPDWPAVPTSFHSSANDEALIDRVMKLEPDLVLVSGTDLLRRATLERLGAKVMNLHTGISPYIKGGPNCTNWALALGEFDLIGNTVMWIDPGIDSGAIIATERTPLTGRETLLQLHIKVMDHAHDLYCRAVRRFAEGKSLPSVPQAELGTGRLFYTRHWDSLAMLRAVRNFAFGYRPFPLREIRLVSLDQVSKPGN